MPVEEFEEPMVPLISTSAPSVADTTSMSSAAPRSTTASNDAERAERRAKRRLEKEEDKDRAAKKLVPEKTKSKKGKTLAITEAEMQEHSAFTKLLIGAPRMGKGCVNFEFNNDPGQELGFEARGESGLEALHQQAKTLKSREIVGLCFSRLPEVFTLIGELHTRLQHSEFESEQAQLHTLSLTRQLDNTRRELSEVATERDEARHEVEEVRMDRDKRIADLCKITTEKETELSKIIAENKQLAAEVASLKEQQINQGVLGEAVIHKLFQTKSFASFARDLCKDTVRIGTASTLSRLGKVYPHLGLRRKKMGWHPDAVEAARRHYVRKVKGELPQFALLEHLRAQETPLSLEEIAKLEVDYDERLEGPSEPMDDFEDFDKDPSEV